MRITNSMTTNKMLLNINRNMNSVDLLYNQLTTGKKIQNPSDNPIIASRALKFRTNVYETEQYLKNTAQGISWMESTEHAFTNVTNQMKTIRELCASGASDQFDFKDRQAMSTQIKSLFEQMGLEMNSTYAGRYVFSGYRTDKPPVITDSDPTANYNITQVIDGQSIETAKVYKKSTTNVSDAPEVMEVQKIKLPYTNVENLTSIAFRINGTISYSAPVATLSKDDPAAYNCPPDVAQYIQETGELILGANIAKAMNSQPNTEFSVNYNKKGLEKGDLNPEIYFRCTDNRDPINPIQYYVDGNVDSNGKVVSQQIEYEFGVNTRVRINNLANESYPASLYGDLKRLIGVIDNVQVTSDSVLKEKYSAAPHNLTGDELDKAIAKQKSEEEQLYRGVLQQAFSNMLGIIDNETKQISKEYTDLGSRMNRLDAIENRLVQDRISYTTLMSENENVDYLEATLNLNAAQYVYQASLKAGGNIMQTSLVDFIR